MNDLVNSVETKDSGIEWIGEIPGHWEVLTIRRIAISVETGSTPSSELPNAEFEDGITWYTPGDFKGALCLGESTRKISPRTRAQEITLFPINSVLVVSVGATIGKVAYIDSLASANQQINAIIPNDLVSHHFITYSLSVISEIFKLLGNVSTIGIIAQDKTKEIPLALPPLEEQQAIANYLDTETARIDALVEKKNRLINLLKEKRQALITHTVTKGLDNTVEMKDSGIEWIGEIPNHWEVVPVKFSTYVKGRIGWHGLNSDEFREKGIHLVTGTDFNKGFVAWDRCRRISESRYKEDPYIQLKENDLLITKDGTIGKLARVKNLPKKASLNSGIFLIRAKQESYLEDFLYWILQSFIFTHFMDLNSAGSTIQHLYQEVFNQFIFPLPSLPIQQAIASYLDSETARIDSIVEKLQTQIILIKEHRQALITAAVTGKLNITTEVA